MVDEPLVVAISSGTSLNPDEIARRTFPPVRKGVDGDAVRRYLESIAEEIRGLLDREAQLRRRLIEAERKAAEPPVLDEATLTRAVGDETVRILQTAHDAAGEVVARAEARAGELVAEAEEQAGERVAAAHTEAAAVLETATEEASTLASGALAEAAALQESAQAEVEAAHNEAAAVLETAAEEAATLASAALAEATALQESAQAEVEALVEGAQEDAVALLSTTRQRCREALREARGLRKSVLSDLVERRRALFVQLEQLRSGRDSLVDVVDAVGGAVEELRERLAGAEHDARVAAAEAGDRAELLADDAVDTLLAPEIAMDLRDDLLGDQLDTEADIEADDELGAVLEAAFGAPGDEFADDTEGTDELGHDGEARAQADIAASHRSVGELFARIRAARETEEVGGPAEDAETAEGGTASASGGETSAGGEDSAAAGFDGGGEVRESAEGAEAPEGGTASASGAETSAGGEDSAAAGSDGEGDGDDESDDADASAATSTGESEGDAAAISKRNALLKPVVSGLSRGLKRALQDDQNELLNAIRHASGDPDLDKLLPEESERKRFEQAASRHLADGWRLGRSWLRADGSAGADDAGTLAALATETGRVLASELASELAGLLRHRLGESLRALGEVGEGAQDAAGAAYREWKGDRVEGIAGDFATRAFAGGAVAAAPEGTIVRWVVDDGRPCPDCDDNALAGDQHAGDEWPTGQIHPPVHPGCRCLLVAITD